MSKVKIKLSDDNIKKDSEISLGDKIKLYLMEGDLESDVLSYTVSGNIVDIEVEIPKDVYERLEFEEDRILDVVDLDMLIDGNKTLYWTYEDCDLM